MEEAQVLHVEEGRVNHGPLTSRLGVFEDSASFKKPLEVHLKNVSLGFGEQSILRNINAAFKPGSMTLVLGPPGCGKTSLLRVSAGYYRSAAKSKPEKGWFGTSKVTLEGEVSYSGLDQRDVEVRNVIGYMQQTDLNIPTLTVRETLRFALEIKAADASANGRGSKEERKANLKKQEESLLRILGLGKCADTMVGGAELRGISGGEQKRVSLGETLAGGYTTLFMDEFSTGLDTSATVDITKVLKKICTDFNFTIAAALLQPPPEVYELFDNIIVLSEGEMVYNGPREQLLPYFESIGYICPSRVDAADFIQIVTTSSNKMFRAQNRKRNIARPIPVYSSEFALEFQKSPLALELFNTLDEGPLTVLEKSDLPTTKYQLPWYRYLSLVFQREVKVVWRDVVLLRSRIVQSIFMGVLVGTLFYQISEEQFQTRINYLWNNLAFLANLGLTRIPLAMEKRAMFYRQQRSNFFPSWTFTLSSSLTQLPVELIEAVLYGTLVYWLGGLASNAGLFFYNLLIMFLLNVSNNQLMILAVAYAPSAVVAQAMGGVLIMTTMCFGGFSIGADLIPAGWIWAYWINPITYAFRALAQNEFLESGDFDQAVNGSTLGERFMDTYDISTDSFWYWVSPLVLVGFAVFYWALNTLGFTFCTYEDVSRGHRDPEVAEANPEDQTAIRALQAESPSRLEEGTATDGATTPRAAFSSLLDGGQDKTASGLSFLAREKVQLVSRDFHTSFLNSIPFRPDTLSWHSLEYSVTITRSRKEKMEKKILQGIDGIARPGQMLALMGASGAGKTTLLDVLARRKNTGVITGRMLVNGEALTDKMFQNMTAYVEQFDRISRSSTVKESLVFSASLRLPKGFLKEQRQSFVESMMDVLELSDISLTRGDALTLSQRKKLSVGIELVSNPSILFLDEPTSGLDSRAALNVISVVKKVSNLGRTVICTVHQPSALLFERFDDLLLLHSGRIIFSGVLGARSANLIRYFQSIPGSLPYQEGQNPASWMLEVIGAGAKDEVLDPETGLPLGLKYAESYAQSELREENRKALEEVAARTKQLGPSEEGFKDEDAVSSHRYLASYATQLWLLSNRLARRVYRLPDTVASKIGTFTFLCFLLGTTYSGIGYDNITSTTDLIAIFASIFFVSQASWIISCLPELVPIDEERHLFYKERSSNYYSVVTYTLAWAVVQIPLNIVYATVFTNILYWTIGYNEESSAFGWFYLLLFLVMCVGNMAALTIVNFTPNLKVANLLGGLIFSLNAMFMGLLINENNMTRVWVWFYWINPLHYFYEGVIVTQFNGDERLIESPATGSPVTVSAFVEFFFNNSFSYDNLDLDAILLGCFALVFMVMAMLTSKYINHEKR